MKLQPILERFLDSPALAPGVTGIVVAFSGGPDSTALLAALTRVATARALDLRAAHLDHGLDRQSTDRAAIAERLCGQLGVPLVARRIAPEHWTEARSRPGSESLEAAARRLRYSFLEETRQRVGAQWIATAHHRDDQIETVMLRLQFGSGIEGLSGIAPIRGRLIRPLLEVPRSDLRETLEGSDLLPAIDPTNRDLDRPRNRLRQVLLPHMIRSDPDLPAATLRVAAAAAGARSAIEASLRRELAPEVAADGVTLARARLAGLAPPLWPFALSLLHRLAGAEYPPREAARRELRRQITQDHQIGCDCGDGWCWTRIGERLKLARREPRLPEFTYTLQVPGEVEVPELGVMVRLSRGPIDAWMFRGSPVRAGLAMSIAAGDTVTIRNRRPGDRIRPLGCRNRRRLKDVLIDRRVPRQDRDRLPLLCLDDKVAWVPGVTIDEAFRLPAEGLTWIAELTPQ